MKKFLTATVCAVFALGCACAFAGCGTDYSDEIKDLQKQIQELENKNNSLQTELNALKNGSGSSTDYTAEINSLKQQIKALETKCNSANSSITKLQQDLNAAKLRLDAVEGAMQADKNYTYQMGEVCTVKSASGIELYKVRLLDYNNSNQLTFNIQNINLPDYINLNDYFTVCTYSEANTKKYSYKRTTFY
ncbi:MAG: hypothetical protein K2G44_04160, partial [Clostridia bacterium]|nr:hypothetical protein [Clostridia bacterium]